MKFRRAASLAATFDHGHIVLHNFLSRERFSCPAKYLEIMAALDEWHSAEELFDCFPEIDRKTLATQLSDMVRARALLIKGSPDAVRDEQYRREWQWGEAAGFFHFSTRQTSFITGAPARQLIRKRKAWKRSPPLYQGNRGFKHVVPLPYTDITEEPFALMRRRRSRRQFSQVPIPLEALADCLFSGNGIVEVIEDKDFGKLPLSMTPSGGARNPFELYVYAQNVSGLKSGVYHYGAAKRDLGLVRAGRLDVPAMLGTQKWPAKAGAIIFLVAHFPRTMWKYHMPMTYRVVMMEAGFIGQNIALAATYHGLSAIPSGALNEDLIEGYLGTPAVESAVVLSMSLGKPQDQDD
jgi:SagB-type dehydrogenase family enzyme